MFVSLDEWLSIVIWSNFFREILQRIMKSEVFLILDVRSLMHVQKIQVLSSDSTSVWKSLQSWLFFTIGIAGSCLLLALHLQGFSLVFRYPIVLICFLVLKGFFNCASVKQTKTNFSWENHRNSTMSRSQFEANTCHRRQERENSRKRLRSGLVFLLIGWEWHEFCYKPPTRQSQSAEKQSEHALLWLCFTQGTLSTKARQSQNQI